MPDPTRYPMDFRPAGYRGGVAELLARIKGAARRRMVEEAIAAGRLREVPRGVLGEDAPRALRAVMEAEDLRNMGGEYLPRLRPNEVEVARVHLPSSSSGDVTSVRAREVKGGYRYRVADEYQGKYHCSPGRSRRPLTLAQLVRLIDTAVCVGDADGDYAEDDVSGIFHARDWAVHQDRRDPADYRHFYRVSSPFYPDLERWYDEAAAEWVAQVTERRAG